MLFSASPAVLVPASVATRRHRRCLALPGAGEAHTDRPATAAHTLVVVHETLNVTSRSGKWLDPNRA
jgi:hypothetical protein